MSILIPRQPSASTERKPIFARSGWEIPQPNETPPPLTAAEMKGWADFFNKRFGAVARSLSRHHYNCVGMIFASRRVWIEIDDINKLLQEDGYRPISREQAVIGDVVLYKYNNGEPAHIGIIYAIETIGQTLNIRVLSKWGRYPEFTHFLESVPDMLGRPLEYYTERVVS
jgi:hypothetical protein